MPLKVRYLLASQSENREHAKGGECALFPDPKIDKDDEISISRSPVEPARGRDPPAPPQNGHPRVPVSGGRRLLILKNEKLSIAWASAPFISV